MKISLFKKCTTFLFLLLTKTVLYSQSKPEKVDERFIVWSNTELLTWNDFKRKSPKHNEKRALSHVGLKLIPVYSNNKFHKFYVIPFFDKTNSTTSVYNSNVLEHEQYHFHIAELFARKIRLQITLLKLKKKLTSKDYTNVFIGYNTDFNNYQIKYDNETNHGMRLGEQKLWQKKIALELELTKLYRTQ